MKPILLFCLLGATALCSAQAVDQNSRQSWVVPFEKVYLHLDRIFFSPGDDIWFRAYLTDAVTSLPSDNSNTLYVELVSPASKIIDTKVIRMDKGLGHGDFHLGDSIASGKYQVRAYTNYMRNFGEIFFFKKEVTIVSPHGIKSQTVANQAKTDQMPDIGFYPEGGALIEEVPSVVGVKAVNPDGLGINVSGTVVSSKGDTVAKFETSRFGMGSFTFTSNRKLKYFAVGKTDSGVPFRIEMPEPLKTGYAIRLSDHGNHEILIDVRTNPQTLAKNPGRELVIVGKSHNALCLMSSIKIPSVVTSALLPKKEFPEGVASISLMDTTGVIYSERLFYVHKKSNIRASVAPDKKTYLPKGKVDLTIAVKDSLNNPIAADLSMAVVDIGQMGRSWQKGDICTYQLLESEIQGYIEQPYYYFDTAHADRYQALDNLLLTQGWRQYTWKEVARRPLTFDYPFEKGFSVSGNVKRAITNKPIKDLNITMAVLDSIHPIFQYSQTDREGKFYFGNLNFSGTQSLIVSAHDKNSQGKGMISVDSVLWVPAPPTYTSNVSIKDIIEFAGYRQEVEIEHGQLKKYKLKDTVMLNTVVVKAIRLPATVDDGHFRVYGTPDKVFEITNKDYGYGNVADYIKDYLKGKILWAPTATMVQNGGPLILLDNVIVDGAIIKAIPMTQVYKIEVLKFSSIAQFGSKGANGVISILLKKGNEYTEPLNPLLSSTNRRLNGYYQARTFYVPRYNVPTTGLNKPDLRTTIFWEPNIQTDADGNARCSFYNADEKASVKIWVEGITSNGTPLVTTSSYEVE